MAAVMEQFDRGVVIHCPQTKADNLAAARWMAERINGYGPVEVTTMVVTMDGKIVSAVGYSKPHFNRIELSWASDTPKWVTRSAILYLLAPPFVQWGYHGISIATHKSNKKLRKFVEGTCFKYEGCLRRAGNQQENIMLYGMLRDDYAQLIKRYQGEIEYRKFIEYCNGR